MWVAPMVNPDGHEHTRTQDRLWRKNRRRNPDGSIGVDPNRNYGYMWGTLNVNTSSHVPVDETYVGPRAFSEPETRAVRNLVARELFGGVLTYHSYSQLILYPWGYTSEPGRGRGRPGHDARARRGHAAADPGRARPDLHRAAGVGAVSDGGRHHGLGVRRVRRALVHRRAAPGHRAGGRVHPAGRPDRALLGGEPAGRAGVPRARPRPAASPESPAMPPGTDLDRPADADRQQQRRTAAHRAGRARRVGAPPRLTRGRRHRGASWPSWSGGGWPRSSVGRPGRSSRRAPGGGTTTSPHPPLAGGSG